MPRASADPWAHSPFRTNAPDLDTLDPKAKFDQIAAYAHPGPLSRFEDGRTRKRVCIVGGGVAGLAAAYELIGLSHEVTLLESSVRFGGRIRTHHFNDRTYGELGAMRIPEDHGCVTYYLDAFGLTTREFVARNSRGWCLFRDAPKMSRSDWDREWSNWYAATPHWERSNAREIAGDLAGMAPYTAHQWWESLSNALSDPLLLRHDATALGQHALGVDGARACFPGELTDEEWEYVGRTAHHIWLERTSLLHWLREGDILDRSEKHEIEGGMEELTNAFVAAIRKVAPDALQLNARVRSIEATGYGATVSWAGPSGAVNSQQDFDYVICTVPAPSTVQIEFSPELSPSKREALTNISYIGAGKTIMRCSMRHWELLDGIAGGTSVTDRPNQQCWYPSDNARPASPDESDHITAETLSSPGRDLLESRIQIVDWEPASREKSEAPGVFLAAYLWGTNAQRFASLSDSERDDLISRSVSQIHPANDAYLEEIVHFSWDAQSVPGGGAFAFFRPGEQRRYQAQLCAPFPEDDPRVFFAGEHVGILHGWIQSAIQSALAAAIEVLTPP